MIALDCTSRIDPAALQAAGVTDVLRYLSWPYTWSGETHDHVNPKIIQQPEYGELIASGIGVTLNWEYDDHDWLSGAAGGAAHAAEAVRQARALGYPPGCAIPGSADFDMSRAQWLSAGRAYGTTYRDGIRAGGYRPGAYGPWDVLTWCRDELGLDVFWQAGMSTSWSGGRNATLWPGAHLRQRGHRSVGGVDADWSEILTPDWGQAKRETASSIDTGDDEEMSTGLVPRGFGALATQQADGSWRADGVQDWAAVTGGGLGPVNGGLFGNKRAVLGLGCDGAGPAGVLVRVAIKAEGKGWGVKVYRLESGGDRLPIFLDDGVTKFSVTRAQRPADTDDGPAATCPVWWDLEFEKR